MRKTGRRIRGPNVNNVLLGSKLASTRSHGLDILRAVLALWVLTAHSIPWMDRLQGAGQAPHAMVLLTSVVGALTQSSRELNPAVLVFIVLSGYCIHRNGLRYKSSLLPYAVRRCARILPIFYVALFASSAIGAFETKRPGAACLMAHATGLSTLIDSFATCPLGNMPLGTVKVEAVLYVLYGVAFTALVWRGRERWVWGICAACAISDLFVSIEARSHFSFYYWWQNWSVFGFITYWWIGAAFVNPAVSKPIMAGWRRLAVAYVIITVVILFLTPVAIKLQQYSPGDVPAAAYFLAEVRKLILALLAGVLIVSLERVQIEKSNPLAALGRAGYSLYALHTPVTFLMLNSGASWYATVAVNIAVAFVSRFVVERPGEMIGRLILAGMAARPHHNPADVVNLSPK